MGKKEVFLAFAGILAIVITIVIMSSGKSKDDGGSKSPTFLPQINLPEPIANRRTSKATPERMVTTTTTLTTTATQKTMTGPTRATTTTPTTTTTTKRTTTTTTATPSPTTSTTTLTPTRVTSTTAATFSTAPITLSTTLSTTTIPTTTISIHDHLLQKVDQQYSVCENFNDFVCNKFDAPLLEGQLIRRARNLIQDEVKAKLHESLLQTSSEPSSAILFAKKFYKSCTAGKSTLLTTFNSCPKYNNFLIYCRKR